MYFFMNSICKFQKCSFMSFSASKRGNFFQEGPTLGNQYKEDPYLRRYLESELPFDYFKKVDNDLIQFGNKVSKSIYKLHLEAERNPPKLEQYDSWGKRVDNLIVCEAWKEQKKVSATEGLIAIAYEKEFDIYSRLYQAAKLYLYQPSSGLYSCPLAMTDGAAKTIEVLGKPDFAKEAFSRLTTRDPNRFYTSGQWMTERKGGSDVADGTETLAIAEKSPSLYKLYGYKWFSSATDSDISITLARIVNEDNKLTQGLTMFFLNTRNSDGSLNNIEVHKLKNKLGTRQLPTAELLLDGTLAYQMSDIGKGISKMSSMLNITRLHNSIAAVSNMRRIINLARDYATKRKAFGKFLIDQSLHCQTLANMEVECRASFLTLMFCAQLLGKMECNQASNEENELLRFLTPILKLYTAKQSIAVCSEGLEAFGGQGYIEDTGLPNLLRDSQVLSIWEGTTNILSLDALRSIQKSKGDSLMILAKHIELACEQGYKREELREFAQSISKLTKEVTGLVKMKSELIQTAAREYSYSLYRLFTASLILKHCIKFNCSESDLLLLNKWCMQDLAPVLTYKMKNAYNEKTIKANRNLFMEGFNSD